MNTKRIGTAEQYSNLALYARIIRDTAEDAYKLALEIGEIGTATAAESATTDFKRIAAVMGVRVDEAKLGSELRVPKAVAAIHDVLASFRPQDHSTAHRDAAVKAGTWARLDAFGDVEPMVTPGILAELEGSR